MKKYYINVWVSVYANTAEEAKAEVRKCLNTGRGHIDGYELGPIRGEVKECPKCIESRRHNIPYCLDHEI